MLNRVHPLSSYCLEIEFVGDQTRQSIIDLIKKCDRLSLRRGWPLERIAYLVNLGRIGQSTSSARKEVAQILLNRPYQRLAIYNASTYMKHLSILILKTTSQLAKCRYTLTRAEALDWIERKKVATLPNKDET